MKLQPRSAQIYVGAVILGGALLLGWRAPRVAWSAELAVLALLALATGAAKVRIPATEGTMSVAYTFVIAAMILIGPDAAMAVAGLSAASQSLLYSKWKPALHRLFFSVAGLALTAFASGWCFRALLDILGTDFVSRSIALFLSSSLYFCLNTFLVGGAIALSSKKPFLKTWHANFLWTAPGYYCGSLIALLVAILMGQWGWRVVIFTGPPLYLIYYSYKLYMARLEDSERHLEEIETLHSSAIEALALAIDAKDQVTHGHIQRVQVYATGLAEALQLPRDEIKALQAGSLLHDVGKLAVPDYILSKPGKLSAAEFQKMALHPVVGAQILAAVNFPYPVVPLVLHHHERWDGTGYPYGLEGEAIPRGARVLSVVDCFDALCSDRPYRKALDVETAMEYVVSERGRSFDPLVVDALLKYHSTLEGKARLAVINARTLSLTPALDLSSARPATGLLSVSPISAFENIAAAHRELSALYELVEVIGTSLNLDESLHLIISKVKKLIPTSTYAFYFLKDSQLVPRYVEGVQAELYSECPVSMDGPVLGWVLKSRQLVVNADPSFEFKEAMEGKPWTPMRSMMVVPLFVNEQPFGTIALFDQAPQKFTPDHARILEMVSTKAAIAIKNSITYEETHESALTDPLTGLPNTRNMFLHLDQELTRARREHQPLTVMAFDLDNFKTINDTYGHPVGDRALREVAQLLKSKLREYDLLCRLGGDEFVAILPGLASEAVAGKMENLQDAFAQFRFQVRGNTFLQIDLSIGHAIFGVDGDEADRLLTVADGRMYERKRQRKAIQARFAGNEAHLGRVC